MVELELEISKILKNKKKTLAIAESCTGGLISHRITNVPGSSDYFIGGIIAYSNDVKTSVLGVPVKTIKKYGAVSCETALAMAKGLRRVLGADIAAAVTGIAGPSGGSRKKPVGLAYIAFTDGRKTLTKHLNFKGIRLLLKKKFSQAVLELIKENL